MLAEQEWCCQVHLKRAIPVLRRELMQWWPDVDPRSVDQDFRHPEWCADQLAGPPDPATVAEIRAHAVGAPAGRPDLGHGIVQRGGLASDDHHTGAGPSERCRYRLADPRAAAGHGGYPACQGEQPVQVIVHSPRWSDGSAPRGALTLRYSSGLAPTRPNALAASRQPLVSASPGGFLSSQDGKNPAQNASPAPVLSTIRSSGGPGTRMGSGRPFAYNRAPSAPSFITTCGYQAFSTRAACSGSPLPVSTRP